LWRQHNGNVITFLPTREKLLVAIAQAKIKEQRFKRGQTDDSR